jgi:hypothetical protein
MQEKTHQVNEVKEVVIIAISIILLTSLVPFGFFEPVYADHASKVIKMQREYPADAGFIDIPLPMRISDLNNTIVFLSFSTPDSADQSDTSRRWELIDERTLRVFGESNTPVGNNAGNLVIYILEMRSDEFNIETQNFVFNMTASQAPQLKTIALSPAVNASRAFVLYNGLENLASDTSWGTEEFLAVQMNDTHIEFESTAIPNTDSNYGFSVIFANVTGILAQRGSGVLNGTLPFDEVTDTITPPIAIDRDHTIVLVTGRISADLNADPDEVMVQVTIDVSGDIIIHRDDNAPLSFIYEWQTMSFPPTFMNVTHGEISMASGTAIATDTITPVRDMDKSFVISGAGSPFGYGTGSCDSGTAGAMDRCMNRLVLTDMDTVQATREDTLGTNVVNYQVIQILETEVAEEPQGTNTLQQIIKVSGVIPSGVEHDVTISPALTNVNKTLVFVSFETDGTGGDPAGGRKSYEIFNSTTLRFMGNADPVVTNPPLNFTAVLVEFGSSSPLVVQNEFFNYPQGLVVGTEKTIHMSPVNTTGSGIINMGKSLTGTDSTIGSEEIDRIRILTSNSWGYDVEEIQDISSVTGSTVQRADIVDFNENLISSQRGQLTMTSVSTAGVVPPITVAQNQTMLLISHQTGNADTSESPDTSTLIATLNSTGGIDFTRPSATGTLDINWELITFPDTLLSIEHGVHHQDAGTTNATSTVTTVSDLDTSFAIGTEGLIGYGTGSSDNIVDASSSFLDVIATVDLEDTSTVRFVRGTSVGDFDVGFQVISFVSQAIFNQTVTDTTTSLDETRLITNKIQTDSTSGSDQLQFETSKTAIDFTVTVDAGQGFNITKAFSDIVVNLDTVNVAKIFSQIVSDITTSLDEVRLTITKNVIDFVTNAETVETVLIQIFDANATDTTTNSDQVNLIVQLKPVIPSGGGAPSSGGDDPVGFALSPVRLIGLNIASEVLVVERGDIETSEFAISWFGDDFEGIKLVNIEAKDDFVGFNQWFAFSPTPDVLDVAHEIGFDNRLPTDPRSQFNTALDDYVLNVPRNDCTGTLVTVVTANCFNPIIYEVPLQFEFELKGATFRVDHIVQIDARDRPKCVILDAELPMQACDVVDFTLEFWWLLALIALLLIAIPKFFIPAGKRKVRVAHFVSGRNDDLLGDDKTSKRLKRLKKVR